MALLAARPRSYHPALTHTHTHTHTHTSSFPCTQKRHNTRLLPGRDTPTDRSGNIPPGTLFDHTICSPTGFDFFLNSHAGGFWEGARVCGEARWVSG